MLTEFPFWFGVLGLLILYLSLSVGRRLRAGEVERRKTELGFPSTAFEAAQIAPEVRKVRSDPLARVRSKPRPTRYHDEVVALAREAVSELSFFGRGRPGEENQHRRA
jgi:hypothetical protein